MKIPAIKKLVDQGYTPDQMEEAELLLINEGRLTLDVEGEDDGEKLTHLMAARWIVEEMENANVDFKTALRSYTKMVRNSIS